MSSLSSFSPSANFPQTSTLDSAMNEAISQRIGLSDDTSNNNRSMRRRLGNSSSSSSGVSTPTFTTIPTITPKDIDLDAIKIGLLFAAPIFRYGDERLNGSSLTKPFTKAVSWVRPLFNPIHPSSNKTSEVAIRLFKATAGIVGMALSAPLALVGRIIQIAHYHLLGVTKRNCQKTAKEEGMQLPKLLKNNYTTNPHTVFTSVDTEDAIPLLRHGFDQSKNNTVYLENAAATTKGKGEFVLTLSTSLDNREVALIDQNDWKEWSEKNTDLAMVQKLFVKNGYRAIRIIDKDKANSHQEMRIFDPNYVSIQKVDKDPSG